MFGLVVFLDLIIVIESSRGSLARPEHPALDNIYSYGQELLFEHKYAGRIVSCAVEGAEFPWGLCATLA